MNRIDGRKSEQDFYNKSSGKRIYCHKVKGLYSVGINGTSYHRGGMDKLTAESYVYDLAAKKIETYK